MYNQIKQNYKCSKCGSTEDPEHVTRNHEIFLRCINCGHESLYSKMTTTDEKTFKVYEYNQNEQTVY